MRARSPARVCLRILALSLALQVPGSIAPWRVETARAEPNRDPTDEAGELYRLGDVDDAALRFASAIDRYEAARALDPRGPRAAHAATRIAVLRAHAEGDFAPYVALERLRRTPALSNDPRAVDALVHDAEAFPPGLVRIEVWVLAAEAYQERFDRPRDAEAMLARVVDEPRADPVLVRKAARDLVNLRLADGDLDGAARVASAASLAGDPALAGDVARARRRRHLHHASIAILASMAACAAGACLRAARRREASRLATALARTWRLALGYAAYVALGGALLASGYEGGTARPFLWLGIVLVPIVLVARVWAAAGRATTYARTARALLCGAAALGAALLVLEGIDPAFLDGLGL